MTILDRISKQVDEMVEPGSRLGFIQRPHVGLSYEVIDEATERIAQRMVALIQANPGLLETMTGDAAIIQKVMNETRWDALSSSRPMQIALRRTGHLTDD